MARRKMLRWKWSRHAVMLSLIGVPMAVAQEAGQEPIDPGEVTPLEKLQVLGSRLPGRSAGDSPVPVDVIDGDSFRNYGVRDMNNLLSATIPSYNVTQHAIGDANALVRPAKMRGLPPDSTLVMINGKRRHRSSAISIFTLWTGAGGARSRHSLDPVHCAQTG